MKERCTLLLTGALLLGGVATADTVYLTDGEVFENVEAEVTETQVRIELEIGRISLPRSRVVRVEDSVSPLEAYRRKEQVLLQDVGSGAEDWLELALWARGEGYERGLKKAARTAAQYDPHLEGLAPLMRGFGYVFEEDLGGWVSRSLAMRSRGFVQFQGAWVALAEREAYERERRLELEARSASRRHDQLDRALEMIADKVDEPDPQSLVAIPQGMVLGTSLGFLALVSGPLPAQAVELGAAGSVFNAGSGSLAGSRFEALANRVPGSFLPIR